ncbi:ectoine/hydroxyectoine ABC transporter permease subunit EhuD [Pigmentiphaga sp.]|uniref:ectoine/hydroxyectoine ABC transporter permease subunit EhuD n=1 Tax=Pigmentiphaga sp. TaxID=1977564 RepID=UPI00128C2E8B|nr:ectoine/hydroxyectoine ABC transporter permease subunit EhuD [Pigmentiphaga sp.]MPS26484.1 ectoine/hydroxyectoine ABC transporter permease subunit EhuD [Alcaligenaceae bacterium SAGV5]MPS53607.1 ectoine/hydroxyectoine ABC transporter permease subunit EhuD [Alcaligenaceae bacterium SAGV3]MPT57357.1 ectoine/hydroxyectoine ABC transporter permease subunit EhuD [Alcaligenaceae bacterium]
MTTAAGQPLFDWDYARAVLPTLLDGLAVTVQATLLGMGLAVSLGLALALMRRAAFRPLAWASALVIEFVRSTPLLMQLFFLFYVLPVTGVRFSPLATGVLGLGVHYAAYCAEVYRAGLESVPRAQWEAALALNLGRWRTLRDVILPQAIPPIVPALGNYFVAMFKDTPLLSAITVVELLQASKIAGSATFRYTEPLTLVGLIFLALSLAAAWGVRRLGARLG